jgi:hypothetical protein
VIAPLDSVQEEDYYKKIIIEKASLLAAVLIGNSEMSSLKGVYKLRKIKW